MTKKLLHFAAMDFTGLNVRKTLKTRKTIDENADCVQS